MSLAGFQRAMCDLIADSELCLRLRREPTSVLERYQLDGRERSRLLAIVRQPGMSVSCTLYRSNRIIPLHTRLPYSCALLGEDLGSELTAFWDSRAAEVGFGAEVENFASFLRGRLASGALTSPYLSETLGFELAFDELRLTQRRRLLAQVRSREATGLWGLNPLLRIVHFDHDPSVLLGELADGRVPHDVPAGPFCIVLDFRDDAPALRAIDPDLGSILAAASPGDAMSIDDDSLLGDLIESRLLVPV
jgi:hypothetical protein